jgi:hypothetical protein
VFLDEVPQRILQLGGVGQIAPPLGGRMSSMNI